jgi:autotransporter passenger strand-loop-strand repeat protein
MTVRSGGADVVMGGGVASGTILSGSEAVMSGGATIGTVVASGGLEYVTAGGIASAAVISGGRLEVLSGGGTGAGAVTFATSVGGILQLDDSVNFAGRVAGFGELDDFIDLRDIVFSSATTLAFTEAPGNTSGTLTVSDGIRTANITLLGQYVTAQFTKASDGHGGTLIGDPPLSAMPDPATVTLIDRHHT